MVNKLIFLFGVLKEVNLTMKPVPVAKEVSAPVSATTRNVSSRATGAARSATVVTNLRLSDHQQTLLNLYFNSAPGQNGIFTYVSKTGDITSVNFDEASSTDKARVTTTLKKILRLGHSGYPKGLVERITPAQRKSHKELRDVPVGFDTSKLTEEIREFTANQEILAVLDQRKEEVDPAIYSLLQVESQNQNDLVVDSSAKQVAAMTVPEAGGDGDMALAIAQEASEQRRAEALQQQLVEQESRAAAGMPVDVESLQSELNAVKLSAPGPATAAELATTSDGAQLVKELGKVPLSTPVKTSIVRDYAESSTDTPESSRKLIKELTDLLGPEPSVEEQISSILEEGSPTLISPPTPETSPAAPAVPSTPAVTSPQTSATSGAVPAVGTTTSDSTPPADQPPGDAAVSTGSGNEPLPEVQTLTGQGVQYTGLSARFHKSSIATFFDSWEKPNWDDGLYNNIKSAGWSKASAVSAMKSLIKSEGPQILVSEVVTAGSGYSEADTIDELNEVLQLHFSLHRNMSRGPRITKVGISLNQLLSSFAPGTAPSAGGDSGGGGVPGSSSGGAAAAAEAAAAGGAAAGTASGLLPSTVATTPHEDPLDGIYLPTPPAAGALAAGDTPVDLATAWNNRKYGMGASQTGLRRLPQVPQLRFDIPDDRFATGSSSSADVSGSLFRAFAESNRPAWARM